MEINISVKKYLFKHVPNNIGITIRMYLNVSIIWIVKIGFVHHKEPILIYMGNIHQLIIHIIRFRWVLVRIKQILYVLVDLFSKYRSILLRTKIFYILHSFLGMWLLTLTRKITNSTIWKIKFMQLWDLISVLAHYFNFLIIILKQTIVYGHLVQ